MGQDFTRKYWTIAAPGSSFTVMGNPVVMSSAPLILKNSLPLASMALIA